MVRRSHTRLVIIIIIFLLHMICWENWYFRFYWNSKSLSLKICFWTEVNIWLLMRFLCVAFIFVLCFWSFVCESCSSSNTFKSFYYSWYQSLVRFLVIFMSEIKDFGKETRWVMAQDFMFHCLIERWTFPCERDDLLVQQSIDNSFERTKPTSLEEEKWVSMYKKALSTIQLAIAPKIKYNYFK